tara:strand:+ start:170 stop:712 length:543 start_codon:yes stop_codon:yes gene_type:complete
MLKIMLFLLASLTFSFGDYLPEGWYKIELYRYNILSEFFNATGADAEPADIYFDVYVNGAIVKALDGKNVVSGKKGDYDLRTPITWNIYHEPGNNYQMKFGEFLTSDDEIGEFAGGFVAGFFLGLFGVDPLTSAAIVADTANPPQVFQSPPDPTREWIFDDNLYYPDGKGTMAYFRYYRK